MKASDYKISRYCLIRDRKIILNAELLIEEEPGADLSTFLSSIYKTFGSEYPKFYKMDLLSKLGFITSEFVLETERLQANYQEDEIAIIISNSQSSLETDTRFQQTITDKAAYYPSPALFVYTLPNLLIGEISIKQQIKGESAFFISQLPDFDYLHQTVKALLQTTSTKAVLTGWIDLSASKNYDSALFLIEGRKHLEKRKPSWTFSPESFSDLYFEHNLEKDETLHG
jgi:hypothetical protein